MATAKKIRNNQKKADFHMKILHKQKINECITLKIRPKLKVKKVSPPDALEM